MKRKRFQPKQYRVTLPMDAKLCPSCKTMQPATRTCPHCGYDAEWEAAVANDPKSDVPLREALGLPDLTQPVFRSPYTSEDVAKEVLQRG